MKPAPFVYYRPETREEAIALLVEHGDEAKILAGGQSLIPMMNLRLAGPAILIDICGIPDLSGISETNGALEIGATTRQTAALRSPEIRAGAPLVHEAMRWIGHPANRNRGTFGGSVAHADPAAELPAVLLALDAEVIAQGSAGSRNIPADDFFESYFTTKLEDGELLAGVRLPQNAERDAWGFVEVARRHGDFAMVGAAFTAKSDGGRFTDARIALFGVAERAIRVREAEAALLGRDIGDAAAAREVGAIAAQDLDPPHDHHASSLYRKEVAGVLVRRAIEAAAAGLENR